MNTRLTQSLQSQLKYNKRKKLYELHGYTIKKYKSPRRSSWPYNTCWRVIDPGGDQSWHATLREAKEFVSGILDLASLNEVPTPVVWYARGGGFKKCGPYKSQVEATNAMRLAKDQETFPPDVFVWPEESK